MSPGKMRCFPVWIAVIAGFCLLLVLCNFFQAGSGLWRAGAVEFVGGSDWTHESRSNLFTYT